MISQQRYIVIYRDTPKDPPRYFGPFVSKQIAERFEQQLPLPQKGGGTLVRSFEPYAPHEIGEIVKAIENDRKH